MAQRRERGAPAPLPPLQQPELARRLQLLARKLARDWQTDSAVAEDALDYEWGYEWPTADQWAARQTYGRCWAPA